MSFLKSKEEFFQGVAGFYENLGFDEYKSLKAINSTTLKEMSYSPLHCHYAFTSGREDSDSLSLGRTAHAAILEPERFKNFLVMPEFIGKTKDGKESKQSGEAKELKAKWLEANKGKEFVEKEEHETASLLAEACKKHPETNRLLSTKSYNELSLVWTDAATGLLCKGRVDRFINLHYDNGDKIATILDPKTTREKIYRNAKNISDSEKMKSVNRLIFNFGYYFSKSFYLRGIETILGKKAESILIFIETNAPFGVLPVKLHDEWIYRGNLEIDFALSEFKRCKESGVWNGYAPNMVLSLPETWMFTE